MSETKSPLAGLKLVNPSKSALKLRPDTNQLERPEVKRIVDEADLIENPKKKETPKVKIETEYITFRMPVSLSKELNLYIATASLHSKKKLKKQEVLCRIIEDFLKDK